MLPFGRHLPLHTPVVTLCVALSLGGALSCAPGWCLFLPCVIPVTGLIAVRVVVIAEASPLLHRWPLIFRVCRGLALVLCVMPLIMSSLVLGRLLRGHPFVPSPSSLHGWGFGRVFVTACMLLETCRIIADMFKFVFCPDAFVFVLGGASWEAILRL